MVNRELEPYTKRLHQFEGLKCHRDRIFSVNSYRNIYSSAIKVIPYNLIIYQWKLRQMLHY